MKCLDTDFLIAILRGKPEARGKLRELDDEGRQATTIVNSFELFYGAHRSRDKKGSVRKVRNLLERLDVLPLSMESSERAGENSAYLASQGESVDFRDATIAAVAVSNGLTLVTNNKNHFSRFRDLELESW